MRELKIANFLVGAIFGSILSFMVVAMAVNTKMGYVTQQDYDNDTSALAQKIDYLYNQLETNKQELDKYKANEEYIKALGADEDTARRIIKASGAMNVSPKF